MLKEPAKQQVIFAHKNSTERPMQIVCEPACSEYKVEPGSEIIFKAEVEDQRDGVPAVETEMTDYGLTIWFNYACYDPDAEIDGTHTDPFNW